MMHNTYTLKKSLGQHFLQDENICQQIVAAVQQDPFTALLEVGPGGGALTKYLANIPHIDLKLVEIDREKITWLQDHYPQLKNKIIFRMVNGKKFAFVLCIFNIFQFFI